MWAGNGRRLGENRNACRVLLRKSEERKLIGKLRVDRMIMLKWITKNKIRGNGLDSSDLE